MDLPALIRTRSRTLLEASIYERVRRQPDLAFDASLAHAPLIYTPEGAQALARIHLEYWTIAQKHRLPMLAVTDTWRANAERMARSPWASHPVNEDHVQFLQGLRRELGATSSSVLIGGQLGPRGDAYRPGEAPTREEAMRFHRPQIDALASAGAEFIWASTLPATDEAAGIADAAGGTGLPYVLSFVIRPDGTVLDGTPLGRAIDAIDRSVATPPAGYAVNCVHPTVALLGFGHLDRHQRTRVIGFQANASQLTPEELDGLASLDIGEPPRLADQVREVAVTYDVPFLGGCCGTDATYLTCLAERIGGMA